MERRVIAPASAAEAITWGGNDVFMNDLTLDCFAAFAGRMEAETFDDAATHRRTSWMSPLGRAEKPRLSQRA